MAIKASVEINLYLAAVNSNKEYQGGIKTMLTFTDGGNTYIVVPLNDELKSLIIEKSTFKATITLEPME